MKAMFLGFAVSILIAIAVGVVLDKMNPQTSRTQTIHADVRL
ncbi:MAG: hypothetical protein V3S95_06815 [Alphaproteobacteria bacterium]|jgi:hypothetical protein